MSFTYARPDLAQQYADLILGRGPFNARSGLFLAAPRRTGKSTFLRLDLVPRLVTEGMTTIYQDLWADRSADPGGLIAAAIGAKLDAMSGPMARTARRFRKVTVAGVGVDMAAADRPDGTLTDGLAEIARLGGAPLALIVDEAQHALSTDAGIAAMFALKAARDAINQSNDLWGLHLIFTGSHRDKLAALVLDRTQPFFGANVSDFPLLDRGYTDAYAAWLNQWLAGTNQFDPQDVWEAFRLIGHRPELLEQVCQDHAMGGAGAGDLATTVSQRADALRNRLWEKFDSDYGALTELQQAVLGRLLNDGADFSPFGKATLAALRDRMGKAVGTSDVQSALDALRNKMIVWRSGRGVYAIEDQGMIEWLRARGVGV